MGSLAVEMERWKDTEIHARFLRDLFTVCVNDDLELLNHRTYIERRAYGMGEKCFHWLWKLIVDEMPNPFSFLEIGVYKGQVLSLIKLLANRAGKGVNVTGVTMLSSFAGDTGKFSDYPNEDYMGYIDGIHDAFELEYPHLIVGDSTSPATHSAFGNAEPFDIVYIDGCHEYDYVVEDLMFYPKLIKTGGLLVVDDASNHLKQPFGFFQGIQDVSDAVRAIIETDPQWEHVLALVHNRVWRRL